MYNSMVFSIFRVVRPSLQSTLEHFHHPQKKLTLGLKPFSFFGSGTSYCWRKKCHSFYHFPLLFNFSPTKSRIGAGKVKTGGKRQR